jgi:cobalt/nickel transport protein
MSIALRPSLAALVVLAPLAVAPSAAWAHFQEILPSADIVPEDGDRSVTLNLLFTHPFEGGPVMEMGKPVKFGVLADGKKTDLMASLTKQAVDGKTAFSASYRIKAPGDYVFYVEPAPYWEAAEKKYIVHHAKVVVDFGSGEGWDKPVGLPVEIEPLVRPYGLWTGNLFRGIVRKNGKPLPFAEIEVEWVNDGSVKAPADPFVTQAIKADAAGEFSYAMPRAGWWGFAALTEGDKPIKGPDGKPAPVEVGGLIWVKTVDMK